MGNKLVEIKLTGILKTGKRTDLLLFVLKFLMKLIGFTSELKDVDPGNGKA